MTRRDFSIAVAALCACTIASPILAAENWPDFVDEYVAQIRKSIRTTDIDGYLAVVKDPGGALLVDVRNEDEFKAGHVPGTVNISRSRLEHQIWRRIGYPAKTDLDRKIYLQCGSGTRATLAAKQLKELGFTNVTAVVMNLTEWEKKGYPFVTAETK